jgi:hypothetical protein
MQHSLFLLKPLLKLYFAPIRLPIQVINQLADRPIESYWATRPFNKNAIKQTDKKHRSKF